jgi:hypothetical protein
METMALRAGPELAAAARVIVAGPVPTTLPEYVIHEGRLWTAQGHEALVWMVTLKLPPEVGGEKVVGLAEAMHVEPEGIKTRMRKLLVSEKYTFPLGSTAMPVAAKPEAFSWAPRAGPLSPLKPGVPFPATVVITPFEILRIRVPLPSTI